MGNGAIPITPEQKALAVQRNAAGILSDLILPRSVVIRRVNDGHLSEPYRTWIDGAAPLPAGVTVLPRTIDVSLEVWRLVYPGSAFVGMGVAFVTFIVSWGGLRAFGGIAFLILSSIILFGVPIWMAHRTWRTFGARREQRANILRQGILVGPEGVLIRLMPNRCYPIPKGRFIKASSWSGEDAEYIRIETRDGPIDFQADLLTVDAAAINQAVRALPSRSASGRGK